MSKKPFEPPTTARGDSRVFSAEGVLISVNGKPVSPEIKETKKQEFTNPLVKDKAGGKG